MFVIMFTINESFIKRSSSEHEPVETQSVPLSSETGSGHGRLIPHSAPV